MNAQYRNFIRLIYLLVIVPLPDTLFGFSDNMPILIYLGLLTCMILILKGRDIYTLKVRGGLAVLYALVFAILLMNLKSQFALTFYVRVIFTITAGWFLSFWNLYFSKQELNGFLKKTLYGVGGLSLIIYILHRPEDGRLSSLFDVHTSKYLFFAFVVMFTYQVLKYNKTSDFVALCFAFLLLSLSLQRGILLTAIFFLLLAFRNKVLKKLTWIALLVIVCLQLGVFDPLINRLFHEAPSFGSADDFLSNINTSGRLEFWTYLWLNSDLKFFGNGLGYSIEIGKNMFEGLNLVHNDFLWLLIDTGFFGIGVLLFILRHIYKRTSKLEDKVLKRVYQSLLFSIPIVMYVDNFVFYMYVYFPLLFAYFQYHSGAVFTNETSKNTGNLQLG